MGNLFQPKDEQEEEPFPFNLDEFVTVDEVVDEPEEHAPSSEPSSEHDVFQEALSTASAPEKKPPSSSASSMDTRSKQVRKRPTSATARRTRASSAIVADTEKAISVNPDAEVKQSEKLKEDAAAVETAVGQQVKTDCESVEKSAPKPLPNDEGEECDAETYPEEVTTAQKETRESVSSCLLAKNQFVPSVPVLRDELHPVSEVQETDEHAEHQSQVVIHGMEEAGVKDEASSIPELPPQDALVTLDEVIGEEENLLDDEADEEELLKQQAGENPEALFTVDEVGGDEAEGEDEQLEKELQGLVTLDEINEEDDDDSFNPEVSI